MNQTLYMQEFRDRIIGQGFTFEKKHFFCDKARINQGNLIIETKIRTIVLRFSELEKITILTPTEKTIEDRVDRVQTVTTSTSSLTERQKTMLNVLSTEKREELYRKYYKRNQAKSIPFNEEEDQYVRTIAPSVLSKVIGRLPSAISMRKNYLSKNTPKYKAIEEPVKFDVIDTIDTSNILDDEPKFVSKDEEKLVVRTNGEEKNIGVAKFVEPKAEKEIEEPKIVVNAKADDVTFTPRQDLFILMNVDQICAELLTQFTVDQISWRRLSLVSQIQNGNPDIFIRLR